MLHLHGLEGCGFFFPQVNVTMMDLSSCWLFAVGRRWSGQNREEPAWQSARLKRKCSFLWAAKAGAPRKARVSFRDNFLLLISGSGLQGKWCVGHKFESPRIWLGDFGQQLGLLLADQNDSAKSSFYFTVLLRLSFFVLYLLEYVTVLTCIGKLEILLLNPVTRHCFPGKEVN